MKTMKKLYLILLAIAMMVPAVTRAQVYQIPNPGFETWESSASDAEPTHWNSFANAECDLTIGCGQLQTAHHENSSDVRPGSTGTHSCRIYATSVNIIIVSVVANGNMTTGRIRGGSTTANSPENYNITRTNNPDFAQEFNGRPDYIKFWSKVSAANPASEARMSAIIHDNYDVRDPIIESEYGHITGAAIFNYAGDNTWHEYQVPFDYGTYGNVTPEYLLLTFTTNKTPGGGSGGDAVYIDDIEFVYVSTLSALQSGDAQVPGFASDILTYDITLPHGSALPTVTATATSVNGVVTITQPTEANPVATITVTQGPSTTTYTINYTIAAEENADLADLQVDGVTVPGFTSATTDYTMQVLATGTMPVVSATAVSPDATMEITQPTESNPVGTVVVTCGSLTKTYTVNITLVEPNADLADLKVNNTTITGFDPAVTEYVYTIFDTTALPTISATAASEYATIEVTQPTAEQMTASVVVTCGSLTKTYTVQVALGVEDFHLAQATLYPNPATDVLNIVLTENVGAREVSVFNAAGQCVMSAPMNDNTAALNVSGLQSGLYLIYVKGESAVVSISKFMKL